MVVSMESGEAPVMEGWLYLLRSNRLGLQFSSRRYFVLDNNTLHCYKFVPSKTQVPMQSTMINSSIRVADNGRESIKRSVFFVFSLYSTDNRTDQLKLGARSSEEAARWIRSLMDATMKECPKREEIVLDCPKKRWQSLRANRERNRMHSIDWTVLSSVHMDALTADVIAPSSWTIIGCNDGLRLFKETKDCDFFSKPDDHPGVMAVSVVDANSESVFRTVMSLGPSRSEWDFCLLAGKVVERMDGHTDIIHKKLRDDWMPTMKRRDLLLQRYWRREDDGTYVILYHSVFHKKYQPEKGYIRASLKSGGYVISPVNQGKQSVVKHMLAIDWKFWSSYFSSSSTKQITMRMLGRIAGLREFFRAKPGNYTPSDFSAGQLTSVIGFSDGEPEHIKLEVQKVEENKNNHVGKSELPSINRAKSGGSLRQVSDAADEFFDVLNESYYDPTESLLPYDEHEPSQDQSNSVLSPAAVFVKKLHNMAVQKMGHADPQERSVKESMPYTYGATLPKEGISGTPCSWAMADPSTYLIRGESYLHDNQKTKATSTLMQMVAADWLVSDKREDDLGSRPGGIVQKYAAQGRSDFFFIVHIQVPGSSLHSLALYYKMEAPLESVPLLERFVKGDDAFRNSRFKLIPYISKGSWIVKQSVGKKACLLGQALQINYFHGSNYIELAVDVGSSTVAKGVVSLVLSYLNNLVIEMAFLIQGNTEEELPEFLLGTCKLNNLDTSKSVPVGSLKCSDYY